VRVALGSRCAVVIPVPNGPAMPEPLFASSVVTRRALLGAVCAAGLASVAGCGNDSEYPAGPLRIASGGQGGVYFAYGNGIADVVRQRLPRLRPEVLITAASIENLRLVARHDAEACFSLADSAALAHFGQPPFAAALEVVALARLYDNYLHVVVHAAHRLDSVHQLRDHPVSVGAPDSGTELIATRVLTAASLDVDRDLRASRLGVDDSAAALAAGTIDAFFFSGGLPTAAIDAVARSMPIRLLDVGGLVPPLRQRFGEVYAERTIPASAYRLGVPVTTVGVPNYLVVADTMEERLAYDLIRVMFMDRDRLAQAHPEGRRLDRGSAINTYPLRLHRGAERFYREAKR
jgi:TRAP transporter TAXI family solute receptor